MKLNLRTLCFVLGISIMNFGLTMSLIDNQTEHLSELFYSQQVCESKKHYK